MDSTEAMTVRRDDSGVTVNAQYPSVTFVQIVQLLVRRFPKPDALIPPNVDPKDDPSKFRKLTDQEVTEVLVKEVEQALAGSSTAPTESQPQQPPQETGGAATISPKGPSAPNESSS